MISTRRLIRGARLGAAVSMATVSIYSALAVACLTHPDTIAGHCTRAFLRDWFVEVGTALGES